MKILTWNVNGLRKFQSFASVLQSLEADIVCIQETRLAGPQDAELEPLAFIPGFDAFFAFCTAAGGYSGVVTYVRRGPLTPVGAGEGLDDPTGSSFAQKDCEEEAAWWQNQNVAWSVALDDADSDIDFESTNSPLDSCVFEQVRAEGRAIITDHQRFVVINVYVPAVTKLSRIPFKIQFLRALRLKVASLRRSGREVIVVGDFNVIPAPLDKAEPVRVEHLREWSMQPTRCILKSLLSTTNGGCDLVDSLREKFPTTKGLYTCWSTVTGGRVNNYGCRIDLVLISRSLLMQDFVRAGINPERQGSDHCPAYAVLASPVYEEVRDAPLREPPKFCVKFLPRFKAAPRQTTITGALQKGYVRKEKVLDERNSIKVEVLKSETQRLGLGVKIRQKRDQNSKRKYRQFRFTAVGQQGIFASQKADTSNFEGINSSTATQAQWTSSARDVGLPNPNRPVLTTLLSKTLGPSSLGTNSKTAKIEHSESDFNRNIMEGKTSEKSPSQGWLSHPAPPATAKPTAAQTKKFERSTASLMLELPPPPPRCTRHNKTCVKRVVKKEGPNQGRSFWTCANPQGHPGDVSARCNFFKWE